jgi:hypothetical protein
LDFTLKEKVQWKTKSLDPHGRAKKQTVMTAATHRARTRRREKSIGSRGL